MTVIAFRPFAHSYNTDDHNGQNIIQVMSVPARYALPADEEIFDKDSNGESDSSAAPLNDPINMNIKTQPSMIGIQGYQEVSKAPSDCCPIAPMLGNSDKHAGIGTV